MPRPNGCAAFGQTPSAIRTPRRTPAKEPGAQKYLAPRVLQLHPVAVTNLLCGRVVRVDHHLGPPLLCLGRRRLGEARIEELPRRAGRQPERVLLGCLLDHAPVVRQGGNRGPGTHGPVVRGRDLGPVRPEPEFSVAVAEAIEEMRLPERRLGIDMNLRFHVGERAPAGILERPVDDLPRLHPEAAVLGA